jgi:hypothetical protein
MDAIGKKNIMKCAVGVGTIVKMQMGVKYTGVWIREELMLNNETLEHYIIVTNGIARSLRIGGAIELKIEVLE